MFWKKGYHPTVVGCESTDEELQKKINEIGCTFQIVDNSTRWCAYAQKWAYEHDFDLIHATSFAYMVSLFNFNPIIVLFLTSPLSSAYPLLK